MRVLLKVVIPTDKGNETVQNEILPKTFGEFIEKWKPEASYFIAENGCRTGLLFFDLEDATDIPTMAEPFFLNLNAQIYCTPAMDAADMKAGVEKAMKNS